MKLKRKLMLLTAFLALAIHLIFIFTGNAMAETAGCMSTTGCHGDVTLVKTITVSGGTETVPLYINIDLYNATAHGTTGTDPVAVECTGCHTDIDLGSHGAVDQSVAKTFGGWARFSKNGGDVPAELRESIPANTNEWTRNYYSTAVAASCPTCHTDQSAGATSAHATIYKLRGAHIDQGLTDYANSQGDSGSLSNGFVGEDYAAGNCNRCHASCQSCHFKSTVSAKNADSVKNHWDEIQATDKYTPSGGSPISVPDSMSEFQMIRTTNIAAHEFRNKADLQTDADGVCEACHIGFNRYAKNAYYWKDEAHTVPGVVKATRVKRHPQAAELEISGNKNNISPLTGGTNTAHAVMECADCHGTASTVAGNIHNLPGASYDWKTNGDVQCTDCHDPNVVHTDLNVVAHMDGTGTTVACTGCHTFGLARDFEIVNTGSSASHEVFIDPETNEVRPVVWKNAEAIAWYSHNWQTLNTPQNPDSCAQKCHYEGNLVGAFVGANGNMPLISMSNMRHPTGTGTPGTCATCHLSNSTIPANILANVDSACGQCHGGSLGSNATKNGAPYMSKAYLDAIAPGMHQDAASAPVASMTTSVALYTVTLVDGSTAGSAIRVKWGDGGSSTGSAGNTLTHTYATAGTFNIMNTAAANGLYDSTTTSVTVPQKFAINVILSPAIPDKEDNAAIGGNNDGICDPGEACIPNEAKFILRKNGSTKDVIHTSTTDSFAPRKLGIYKVRAYKLGYTFDCDSVTVGNQNPVTVDTSTGSQSVTCTHTP